MKRLTNEEISLPISVKKSKLIDFFSNIKRCLLEVHSQNNLRLNTLALENVSIILHFLLDKVIKNCNSNPIESKDILIQSIKKCFLINNNEKEEKNINEYDMYNVCMKEVNRLNKKEYLFESIFNINVSDKMFLKMLSNLLEYFCCEILELSGFIAIEEKVKTISEYHIRSAINKDEELKSFINLLNIDIISFPKYPVDLINKVRKINIEDNNQNILILSEINNSNINDKDIYDCTLLHYLCMFGYYDLSLQYIKIGANIDIIDFCGRTSLSLVKDNIIEYELMMETAKKYVTDNDPFEELEIPLTNDFFELSHSFVCERYDYNQTVNELLWNSVNTMNLIDAKIAIYLGASNNVLRYPDKVTSKLIIGTKDDENYESTRHNYNEDELLRPPDITAYVNVLMRACQLGDLEMIKLLDSIDANVNNDSSYMDDIIIYNDGFAYGGITPLMCALNHINAVKLIISMGGDIDSQATGMPGNENISFPKHTALLLSSNDEVSKYLVRSGANVNYAAAFTNGYQKDDNKCINCYWLYVVGSGNIEWASDLLDNYQADPNWPKTLCEGSQFNSNMHNQVGINFEESFYGLGQTVLMMAVSNNDYNMVKLLLEHGADPNLKEFVVKNDDDNEFNDYECATPLSIAINNLGKTLKSKDENKELDNYYIIPNDELIILNDPIVNLLLKYGSKTLKSSSLNIMSPPSSTIDYLGNTYNNSSKLTIINQNL
jgi:ankyrin repeat protein